MEDRVLHESESWLGERSLHRVAVNDVLRRSGELRVEVEARHLAVGGSHHALVDVLEALEAVKVSARLIDSRTVSQATGPAHARSVGGKKVCVKRKLSLRQRSDIGGRCSVAGPRGGKRCGEKVNRVLWRVRIGVGYRDQVCLQRTVGRAVVGIRCGSGRHGAKAGQYVLLRGGQQQAAEFVCVGLAGHGVESLAAVKAHPIQNGRSVFAIPL